MKLRYYMRGLGIGIVVTALAMGIAGKDNAPMTDAEIKAAAYALGMVESGSLKLSDIQTASEPEEDTEKQNIGNTGENAGAQDSEEAAGSEENRNSEELAGSGETQAGEETTGSEEDRNDEETAGNGESQAGEETVGGEEIQSSEETAGGGETQSSEETPVSESEQAASGEPGGTVTITIKSGSGSRTVCNQLAEAGLIEDAGDFDQYLMDNGYSRRICVGTYEIEIGSEWEKIAKIITRTK